MFSPILISANKQRSKLSNTDEINTQLEEPDYIAFHGTITDVNLEGKFFRILAENNSKDSLDSLNAAIFYVSDDVILLNDKTKDYIDKDDLKEGMKISVYYHKNTMMALSMPPQLTPNVIVTREEEEPINIEVYEFNKNLISKDGILKITPSEDTTIVDIKGNKLDKEDVMDRNAIVFYTMSTKSIPAHTTPEKIIVMDKRNISSEENGYEVSVMDKILIDEKEILLKSPLYKNQERVVMLPLRQVAEILGYEVKWSKENQSIELTKGAQWTQVKIGEDDYNFARMKVQLGTAPELKDSTTYIPLDFINEILKANVEITKDGIISIRK